MVNLTLLVFEFPKLSSATTEHIYLLFSSVEITRTNASYLAIRPESPYKPCEFYLE